MNNNRTEKAGKINEMFRTAGKLWHRVTRTKKVFAAVTFSLVLVIGVTLGAAGMITPSYALASKCTLNITSGEVDVILQGAGEQQVATDGMTLDAGDRVITGAESQAELVFFDGSILNVEPGTEIEITKLEGGEHSRTILLKQWIGKTYSRVEKIVNSESQYEIETPSAVAAVRGTQFYTEVNETGSTTVSTTEGIVSVSGQGEEVMLPLGWQTQVEVGTTPTEPEKFDSSEYVKPGNNAKKDTIQEQPLTAGITKSASPVISIVKDRKSQGSAVSFGNINGNQVSETVRNNDNTPNDNNNQNDKSKEDKSDKANGKNNNNDDDEQNINGNKHQANDQSGGNDGNRQVNNNGNGQGNGNNNPAVQGNGNGQGNGNDKGQGNGNDNGKGNGNDNSQGNGNDKDNGQGNGNNNGQGNGDDKDNGQGNGNDNGQGNGNDNGQGNGDDKDNGQGNGNDNGQGNGNDKDNDQGNGNDNGQGNGNDKDNGNGNGDEDKGNGKGRDKDNGSVAANNGPGHENGQYN